MLDTGDSAPDFSLAAADEPYAAYMLSAAAQDGPVVVAFVPSDMADTRPFLQKIVDVDWSEIIDSIAVYAVGAGGESLAELAESDDFSFPILADSEGSVRDAYDIATRSSGDPRRGLVLVDPLSNVQFAWQADDAEETPPMDELESAVASISARDDTEGFPDDE